MSVTVHHGDCLNVLATLPAATFHACVTDPPYHLTSIVKRFGSESAAPAKVGKTGAYARASAGFMGKQWDGGDVAFRPETWAAVARVLKPGAHLLAFGGTRTFHRMACAIEDAGFELRDTVMWVYGSGFPKSHDVSKGIDKAAGLRGTFGDAKTPAHQRYVEKGEMRGDRGHDGWQRPWMDDPEAVANAGRLYVPATAEAAAWTGWNTSLKPAWEPIIVARKPLDGTVAGNVLAHECGALNIDGCRVPSGESTVRHNHDGAGTHEFWRTGNGADYTAGPELGRWPANVIHDGSDEVLAAFPDASGQQRFVGAQHGQRDTVHCYGDYGVRPDIQPRSDAGSAARFFYSAKATAEDRIASKHPTVKPLALMRYLVRLVTPPGGQVLDCFAGSGTTGMACMAEGFDATLIEREPEYVADIRRRIAHVSGADAPLFAQAAD